MFHSRVQKFFQFGERNNFVEFVVNLGVAHAEHRAVQVNVLASRQFRMKARADLQQAANAALEAEAPEGWLRDAREDLDQRAFARAGATDNAHDLALANFE